MGTILVTGAGRGIGAATAVELAARGDHVVVNYRRDEAAAAGVVARIRAAGGIAEAVQADVTVSEEAAELVSGLGRVDAVVLNANTSAPPSQPLAELDWEVFRDKVNGELAGAFHVLKAVLPGMRRRGGGRVVVLGSTAADYVGPGRLAHGTAKAALRVFARQVAAETARDGISVVTVEPDAVRTEGLAAALDDQALEALAGRTSRGRMVSPEDVAAVVALALDPAVPTGTVLTVDAGRSLLVGGPR